MISVIIVNWNSGIQLSDVLMSIDRYNSGCVTSVIIVDNASSDNSLYLVELKMAEWSFPLKIVRNLENRGFGDACNQGAALSKSEFLLFLNPDACLFPDSLSKAVEFMRREENANVGVVGLQLLDEQGNISRSCSRFPDVKVFIAHTTGINRFSRFSKLDLQMTDWAHDKNREVDHVIGAFYLMRRNIFESIKGFDERFFVYLEDLDLSLRIRQAGYRIVFLAEVQAFHAGGGTSQKIKARRLFYSLRSRLLYVFKHFSWIGAIGVLLATLLIEPFSRSALALMRRSWPNLKETWIAYGLLWRWLPKWIFDGVTR